MFGRTITKVCLTSQTRFVKNNWATDMNEVNLIQCTLKYELTLIDKVETSGAWLTLGGEADEDLVGSG